MQHKLGTAYKGHEIFISVTLSVFHFFVKVSSEKNICIYNYYIKKHSNKNKNRQYGEQQVAVKFWKQLPLHSLVCLG